MFELSGKYNSCKVFTDNVDNETISQLMNLMNQDFISGSKLRIMPDTHAGKGCVIGTTMTITNKIVPDLVGVDIGCFTGDTPVWLSAGHYERIDALVDKGTFMVDSFDTEQNCFVVSKAIAKLTRKDAELVRVEYTRKSLIGKEKKYAVCCTPDHKFLVDNTSHKAWVMAKDLHANDKLMASDDMHVYVDRVCEVTTKADVYCLTVEETHNFLIDGGIVVHNCGMRATKLADQNIDFEKLDHIIREYVPAGFEIHDAPIAHSNIDCIHAPVDIDRAYKSLGTLGGGNHFIEVDVDKNKDYWLVIHTGSRHLGIEICEYYQALAYENLKTKAHDGKTIEQLSQELIEKYKVSGEQTKINAALKKLHADYAATHVDVPFELAYLEGIAMTDYLHDMQLAQEHAMINRKTIADRIISQYGLHAVESFDTIHNYIDVKHMILRKGAISAQLGEKVIIPMNMRDGSLICIGKGNEDWNYSAPHGAGRILSRSKAKEQVSMQAYQDSMQGIYTTSVSQSTLDESPFAYKPIDEIMENIKDTVDITDIIKPVYNFKAS